MPHSLFLSARSLCLRPRLRMTQASVCLLVSCLLKKMSVMPTPSLRCSFPHPVFCYHCPSTTSLVSCIYSLCLKAHYYGATFFPFCMYTLLVSSVLKILYYKCLCVFFPSKPLYLREQNTAHLPISSSLIQSGASSNLTPQIPFKRTKTPGTHST